MSHEIATFFLDTKTWDLVVDAFGNIAVANKSYARAQDAASSIRLFKGELYYDTKQGVPHFQRILAKSPPLSYMKAKFKEAALKVPGVVTARVFISAWSDRTIRGQVQIRDIDGNKATAGF